MCFFLQSLLNSQELSQTPFCVLGNKIDKPGAASEDELRLGLGLLQHVTYGKEKKSDLTVRPVEVFMCSIVQRMGYAEAFTWLAQFLP